MTQYIIRRLLLVIPTLAGVSLLVTAFVRLLPGDAVDILTANNEIQGSSQILKEMVDARLQKEGVDPLRASFGDRGRIEKGLVDAEVSKAGIDPANATDAQRTDARNSLSRNAYKDAIRARLGLDKSYLAQWWSWVTNALQGDLGVTLQGNRPVWDDLRVRIPTSIELGVLGMLISIAIAIPVGVISAVAQDSWVDYIARSGAIAMLAFPSFFLATLAIAMGARWFGYSPPIFYRTLLDNPAQNLELISVPAIILGIGLSGQTLRLTRAEMLDVLRQDYIRTARAKGLVGRVVIIRHGVRNALIPVVTIIGLQVPVLVGGSLVLEQIYGIPGVARYLFDAIAGRDFPVIIAVNMLIAVVIIFSNLVVDLTYAVLDPRIRFA